MATTQLCSWRLALAFVLMSIALMSIAIKLQITRHDDAFSDLTLKKTRTIPSNKVNEEQRKDDESSNFVCLPMDKNQAKQRTPLLVFSMKHAGSSQLIDHIHDYVEQRNGSIEFLSLFDIFATNKHHESGEATAETFRAVQAMVDNCIDKDLGPFPQLLKDQWNETAIRARPLEALDFLQHQERKRPTLKKLVKLSGTPAKVIHFLSRIPSHAPYAFMGVRIIPEDLGSSPSDTMSFVSSIHETFMSVDGNGVPTVVIVMQRRLIASYVLKEHQKQKTKKIVIQKAELDAYIEETTTYWKTLKATLETLQIPYRALEYERDIASKVSMKGQLDNFFHIPSTFMESEKKSNPDVSPSRKQRRAARTSFRAKVSNWEEVVGWGYGSSGPWENLFE